MFSESTKLKVQQFGRFLSNMVMPNIGAFIAWGFITALFIKTGWFPVAALGGFGEYEGKGIVGPMITYLLPLLIGYTGGKLAGGDRGAVVGAITTMGVIVGSDIPMFLGAMIVGPLGGWAIKTFDRAVDGKIKSGFEMLVNNFSAGIIGMILALLAFFAIGPAVKGLSGLLAAGVDVLIKHGLLPLTSVFVEPAKVLFLNNAINHGIFSPLGVQQVEQYGKSIFFLIEANPGPGLGVRILGEVKREYADLLRQADAIFIEELRTTADEHGTSWYDLTSQAFAVFLPVKSVGVMGDGRTYDYVVALRAVITSDFMTAHWAELPYALLGKVSNRIINEVRGINRVVYDVSGKPPATIEWE